MSRSGEANAWFKALFDEAGFSAQVFDAEGTCVYANREWTAIWGPPSEAVLGYNILKDPQLQGSEVIELVRRVYAGETVRIPPVFYDPSKTPGNPEGKARWCAADASPVRDAEGRVGWILLRHEDVTEQIEQQRREEELQGLFEAAFEQSNDAIFLHDLEGRFMRANRRALEMFRLKAADIPRMSIRDVHPASALEDSRRHFEQFLRDGHIRYETIWKRSDGTEFPGEVTATRILLAGRKIVHAVVRDLTDLRMTERRLNTLFDLIPAATLVTRRRDGTLLFSNRAGYELTGLSPEQARATPSSQVYVNAGDRQRMLELLERDGEVRGFEARMQRADGSTFWGLIHVRPFDMDGEELTWMERRPCWRSYSTTAGAARRLNGPSGCARPSTRVPSR